MSENEYELPETLADGTPIEPCGVAWLTVYDKDGARKLVTSEEAGDHPSWLQWTGRFQWNPFETLLRSEKNA